MRYTSNQKILLSTLQYDEYYSAIKIMLWEKVVMFSCCDIYLPKKLINKLSDIMI